MHKFQEIQKIKNSYGIKADKTLDSTCLPLSDLDPFLSTLILVGLNF